MSERPVPWATPSDVKARAAMEIERLKKRIAFLKDELEKLRIEIEFWKSVPL